MEDIKWLEVAVNTTPERLDEVTAKLTAAGCGDRIATIWGVGYKWQ